MAKDGLIHVDVLDMELRNDLPHWLDPIQTYGHLIEDKRRQRHAEHLAEIDAKLEAEKQEEKNKRWRALRDIANDLILEDKKVDYIQDPTTGLLGGRLPGPTAAEEFGVGANAPAPDPPSPGWKLTSKEIIREAGTVKPNSVAVPTVAQNLNDRAGAILMQDLGVPRVDLDNRNEATDDYLAEVIARELKDGLHNGKSAADWYDKTMKEAMATAEKIYPEIATDPDARFMYTVALAITSQGEVVDSSVRLTDVAYTQFQKTGKFPTKLEVKQASINKNFKKVNALVEKGGIAATRELFNSTMTARELKARTGYAVPKVGVDDMVHGSAYLGPKIGMGFYQNLNGNFEPITMDLWFMRSWGRITNTGVEDSDITEQLSRFNSAVQDEKLPLPESPDAQVELAREVYKQHEKDYKDHKKEYQSGKRTKTEMVHAAERLVMRYDGALVEAPRGSKQRRWITDVFYKALDKLEAAHGIRLQPAAAQATWWTPEKILYDALGARVREVETDYARSLAKLAKGKGIEL